MRINRAITNCALVSRFLCGCVGFGKVAKTRPVDKKESLCISFMFEPPMFSRYVRITIGIKCVL